MHRPHSRHQCGPQQAHRYVGSARHDGRSRPHECPHAVEQRQCLFQSKRPNVAKIAASIETAIKTACGISAAVTVTTAQELDLIVNENPLLQIVDDHARHLVAFVTHPKHLEVLRPMLKESWTPDALAITKRAAYLWCATGILDSKLLLSIFPKGRRDGHHPELGDGPQAASGREGSDIRGYQRSCSGAAGRPSPSASSIATPALRP